MANENDTRVLGRVRARILAELEMSAVTGGEQRTGILCSFNPKTGQIDGPVIDCG